jgi:hypothetical protein
MDKHIESVMFAFDTLSKHLTKVQWEIVEDDAKGPVTRVRRVINLQEAIKAVDRLRTKTLDTL